MKDDKRNDGAKSFDELMKPIEARASRMKKDTRGFRVWDEPNPDDPNGISSAYKDVKIGPLEVNASIRERRNSKDSSKIFHPVRITIEGIVDDGEIGRDIADLVSAVLSKKFSNAPIEVLAGPTSRQKKAPVAKEDKVPQGAGASFTPKGGTTGGTI